MNGSVRRRLVALCLAAVFPAASAGTLVAGHGCPHHDGLAAVSAAEASHGTAASTGATGPYAAHGVAEPRGHGGVHHGGPMPPDHPGGAGSPGHHDDTSSFCTCVGDCHAGATVPHVGAPAVLRLAPAGRTVDEPATAREHHPRAVAYFLPFANGPPAA